MFNSQRWRELLAAITDPAKRARLVATLGVLIAALGGVTIAVVDNGPDHGPGKPRGSVTVTIGGHGSAAPSSQITLTPKAQAIATAQAREDAAGKDAAAESDLNAPAPAPAQLGQGNDAAPAGQTPIPSSVPQAAQHTAGCVDAFVRNQSSRNGAKVALGVIHWTASSNIANSTADGLAIVRWFDNPAAQASSNYVTDDDGHCYYTVPETAKSWTQASANPWSVSVEVINPGVLPLFHGTAGRNRVLALMRGWHARWGLPYRRGAVNASCVPTRSGFLAHRDLGPCGGGHPDVGPSPATVDGLIHDAAASSAPKPTAAQDRARLTSWERGRVACLEGARNRGRRPNTHAGHWAGHAGDHRKAIACRSPLERRRAHLKGSKHDARYRAIGRVLAA